MGFGGELKDDGVGRRKAAVHRDVHAHCVQVAGEANDVSLLPLALVRLFAIVPLELSSTVDLPRVLVVAHTVVRSPAYSLKTSPSSSEAALSSPLPSLSASMRASASSPT
jgi:hypothetical protein